MPEFKPIRDIKSEPFKGNTQVTKTWITANLRPSGSHSKDRNIAVEIYYHDFLKRLKKLYMSLPDSQDRTVFERDYRYDISENFFTMHSFITSSLYFKLECMMDYSYRIEYDLYNCPFEQEIMEWINDRNYYIKDCCKQSKTKPNCKQFFQRVIQVQEEKFVTILPYKAIIVKKDLK